MPYIIARQSQLRDIRSKIKNAPEGKRSQEIAYQLFKNYGVFDGLSGKAISLELGLADSYSGEVNKFIHLGRRIASEYKPDGLEECKSGECEYKVRMDKMEETLEDIVDNAKEAIEAMGAMEIRLKASKRAYSLIAGIGRFTYRMTVFIACFSLASVALYLAYLSIITS